MSAYDETVPLVRVLKGNPSDEELAALVGVLEARTRHRAVAGGPRRARGWIDRSRLMRRHPRSGSGAWRTSTWPDR